MKPISKARLSSLIMKAGTSTLSGVSAAVAGGVCLARSKNIARSSWRVWVSMKAAIGAAVRLKPSSIDTSSFIIGRTPSSQACFSGLAMMKAVRNSARLTMTALGGLC